MVLHEGRGGRQLQLSELGHDLEGFGAGGGTVLAGVDGFEHGGHRPDLGRGYQAPDIAVEVNGAALIGHLWVELAQALDQPKALVAGEQLDALESAFLEVAEEVLPGGLVLLGALGDAEYLSVAILLDPDGNEDADVADFATPRELQPNAVEENVGVLTGDRLIAPGLDLADHLLVELADGAGWGSPACPTTPR